MSEWLQVCCGPYGLLFELSRVIEVGDAPVDVLAGGDRCVWRDQQLPLLNLSLALSGRCAARPQCLVLENDTSTTVARVLVIVDSIVSIREGDSRRSIDVPWVNSKLASCFAGAWFETASKRCLFQVRLPLDIASLAGGGHRYG